MGEASLGTANVAIRATMDKLDGDLAGAKSKIGGAVQNIAASAGRNLQAIGVAAIGGIGAAAGAVAGLGAALAKITIDAAPVQGISDAFEGLAESAGIGGDEMLAALQRGSSGMIPARDLMLSFNKAASLVGIDFAKELPSAMQYLGKVSASTGQDMGFLMDSLVVGVGRLSPMILDNLGIQVDLASATARASEMFAVEAGELDKTQIQAGMMNLALEKLAINTAAMPDVSQSAAAKMAAFKTTIQDTKDKIGMAFLPTLTTLMGVISKLAEQILPPLTSFLEGTLAPAFEKVAGMVENFMWMLGVGVAPIDALKMALSTLFGPEIEETITGIVTGIGEFVAKAQEALAPVVAWVTENVKLQDVLAALGIALAIAAAMFLPIIGHVAVMIGVFAAVIAIVAVLREAWEANFLGIRDIAASVWGWLQEFIPQALQTIQETFNTIVTAIQEFWAAHGEQIKTTAQAMWDAVVAIFEFFKGQFETLFQAFSLAFQGDWRGFGEKLREYWDQAWAKIKEIGEKTWAAIRDFFKNTDWGSVGRGILEGIAKGITAGWGALRDAARNAAKAALDAAKGFLGIHSPSTVAAQEIGRPFVEGISQGMSSAVGGATDEVKRVAAMIKEAAQQWLLGPSSFADELGDLQRYFSSTLKTTDWMNDWITHLPAQMRDTIMGIGQRAVMQGNIPVQMMASPVESANGPCRQSVVIYGLTLNGVQDAQGLLAELQGLAL